MSATIDAVSIGTLLLCPGCGDLTTHLVIDSRPHETYIRRRRKCQACAWKWTTYETPRAESVPLDVDKVCRAIAKAMGAHPATEAATAMLRAFLAHLARAEQA